MATTPDHEHRELKLPCINCSRQLDVDKQYPPGLFPRTLELYCSSCGVVSLHYLSPPWPEGK